MSAQSDTESSIEDSPWRDKHKLEQKWVDESQSCREIARQWDCSPSTVSTWLNKHDLLDQYTCPGCDENFPNKNALSNHQTRTHTDQGWRNEETLRNLYHDKGMTMAEIAEHLGCRRTTVIRWMDKRDIETRSPAEGRWHGHLPDDANNEELLSQLYINQRLSTKQIATKLGCSKQTVISKLKEFDIPLRRSGGHPPPELENANIMRRLYIDEELTIDEIADKFDSASSTVGKWIEIHGIETRGRVESQLINSPIKLRSKPELTKLYIDEEQSMSQIADELDVSITAVYKALDRHGIETRGFGLFGEDHPRWKGGTFPYGQGWTEAKKEAVRERDNRTCQSCGRTETEHIGEFGTKHHVHHIIPARHIDDPEERNAMSNLVTLCHGGCHAKWEGVPLRPAN